MGYWTSFFVFITLEEQILFRRQRLARVRIPSSQAESNDDGFNWEEWQEWRSMPVGVAALTAFLVGWAGAVVGMKQAWYTGLLAKVAGDDGCDLGLWIGSAITLVTYPALRTLELRAVGR